MSEPEIEGNNNLHYSENKQGSADVMSDRKPNSRTKVPVCALEGIVIHYCSNSYMAAERGKSWSYYPKIVVLAGLT